MLLQLHRSVYTVSSSGVVDWWLSLQARKPHIPAVAGQVAPQNSSFRPGELRCSVIEDLID